MGSPNTYSLILDQGGSSSRAIVFDQQGREVAKAQRAVSTARPQPGWVEQSPTEVVASLCEVAAEVIRQLNESERRRLAVAGLVCQRSSLVAWDRSTGESLTPILSWQDTRASEWLRSQSLDMRSIQQITGLYPNAHFGASKMNWCLQQMPTLKNCDHLAIAPLASYLAYSLLRERPFLVDPANASRTLLMDLSTLQWSSALLQQFAIERTWLPSIVPSYFAFGTLTVAGLELPFKLLNGDQSAAAFASGVPNPELAYINVGTGAFIYRALSQPLIQDHLLCSLLFSDGEQSLYAMEGTVNGAASALQWFEAQCEQPPDLNLDSSDFFSQQAQLPLFLNGVGGLGAPDWRADFPTQFVGGGSEQQKALAVLESIAFLLMRNFQKIYAYAPRPRRILISGGLSRNNGLCQLLANLTQVDVERVSDQESSARGAAFLLAEDRSQWQTGSGELFLARADSQTQKRYQQWSRHMEQLLEN